MMAGYKTNDIIDAMPGVLNAAAAGQVELGTAADITSNVLSGFGLQASETSRVADVLTKAFTSSNTSMESLGETMKYAAPVAKAAGFSLEETAAAAGILGDAGISGSQAGTTLRGVMLRLINPPKQAAEALDALGISVTDSSGKMKPLYKIIEELQKATAGMTDAQKSAIIAQIAGQNAASGFLAIIDAGPEKLKKFTDELENSAGTAEEVAAKQLDNLQGDIALLKSALEGTGISVYKGFNEPLRAAVQTLTEYVEALNHALAGQEGAKESLEELGLTAEQANIDLENMPSGLEKASQAFGGILADILLKVSSAIPKILQASTTLMMAFIDGVKENKSQLIQASLDILQSFVQVFLTVVPEMIVLGIEMLTGLIQGLVQMMPELIKQAQEAILSMANAIVENLPLMLEAGIQIIIMLAQGIAEMMPELITQFIELVIMLADVIIENLPMMIEAGLQIILAIAQGLIENLPTLIEHVPRIINAFFDAFIENLPQIIMAGMQLIWMLIVGIIQAIPTLIANIPAIVRAIVNVITMYNWAQLGKSIMTWLKDGIMAMPGKMAEAGRNIAKSAWEAIKGIFKDAPKLGSGFIRWLIQGIRSMLGSLASSAGSLAKAAWNAILGIFRNAPSLGRNFINWLRSGISSMTGNLGATARNISIAAMRAVKGVFKGMPGIGKQFVKGLWSGIASLTGWIGKQIAGFAKGLVRKFKDFFKIKSPSRLMRDEIGKNLALGIGVGLEDETPDLSNTIDREMSNLTKQMKATVDLETANLGIQVKASDVIDKTPRHQIFKPDQQPQGNVYTIIEIDGREVARTITPYTSRELTRLVKGCR